MRKLLVAAALLIVVVVGVALLAAANLDTWLNENRERLGTEIQRIVGREVSFGEVEVSIWSGFGVRVADVSIGDDPAYSKGDFVTAEMVEVRVDLLPALLGEIRVGRVVLREPTIRVIQSAKGLSLDSLGGESIPSSGARGADQAKSETSPEAGASGALALTVSLIDVQGGRFVFVDRTVDPPTELTLTQLDFSASDVSLTEPIRFDLRAAVLGSDVQNVTVSGRLGPVSSDEDEFSVDVELSVGPVSIGDAMAQPVVKAALPADLSASGALVIEARVKGPLDALTLDGELDATDTAFAFESPPSGEEAGGFGKSIGQTLRFEWSVVQRGSGLKVSKADLQWGDTRIHLEAEVKDFPSAPRATFSVRSDRVRLGDFGVGSAEGGPIDEIRDLAIEGRLEMPAAGPRLTVALVSPDGVVSGAAYQDLKFDFEFSNGRATIKSLTMGSFGGSLEVSGYYDLGGGRPSFNLDARFENVSVAQLVASQQPSMSGMVEGTLAANLTIQGRGSAWEEIRDVMTGTGNLVMEDGTLKDVNLADNVIQAITGIPGLSNLIDPRVRQKYPSVFGVGDTVFERLDAKLDIRGGVASVRDFRLAARDYSLAGEGTYALRDELDLRVAMTLSEALTGDLVASAREARYLQNAGGRIEIPVRLRGGLANVRAEPDLRDIVQIVQRELLGGLLKQAFGGEPSDGGQGETSGEELLRRGLEGLFGGGRQ